MYLEEGRRNEGAGATAAGTAAAGAAAVTAVGRGRGAGHGAAVPQQAGPACAAGCLVVGAVLWRWGHSRSTDIACAQPKPHRCRLDGCATASGTGCGTADYGAWAGPCLRSCRAAG